MNAKDAFDVRHPVFRPLWRRLVITAFCLGLAGFDLFHGQNLWAIAFGASGLYLFIQFFLRFDPADYEKRNDQ